jgi:hypothetical protein
MSVRLWEEIKTIGIRLTESPRARHKREPLSPHPQRHQIGHHNLRQGDDAAAADALDRPSHEHEIEVARERGDDGAGAEEGQADEEHGLAAEDGAEGAEHGLEDGAGQQEAGAGPEGLHGGAAEGARHDGQGDGERGGVERDHERDGRQAEEGQVEAPAGVEGLGAGGRVVGHGGVGGVVGGWWWFVGGLGVRCEGGG